jgi:hypothetical protein
LNHSECLQNAPLPLKRWTQYECGVLRSVYATQNGPSNIPARTQHNSPIGMHSECTGKKNSYLTQNALRIQLCALRTHLHRSESTQNRGVPTHHAPSPLRKPQNCIAVLRKHAHPHNLLRIEECPQNASIPLRIYLPEEHAPAPLRIYSESRSTLTEFMQSPLDTSRMSCKHLFTSQHELGFNTMPSEPLIIHLESTCSAQIGLETHLHHSESFPGTHNSRNWPPSPGRDQRHSVSTQKSNYEHIHRIERTHSEYTQHRRNSESTYHARNATQNGLQTT